MTAPSLTSAPLHESEPRGRTAGNSCAAGVAVGAGVVLALAAVRSAGTESVGPLPAYAWAAAFLFCVVWQDVWRRRIPNVLTFPALLAACSHAAFTGGMPALLQALAGATLAIALLFVPFAAHGMGAGDLKAAAVIGALWGPCGALGVITWAVFFAGAAATVLLAARGGLAELGRRWFHSLGLSLALRRFVYLPPAPGSTAAAGLPFGAMLGLGAAAYCRLGMTWFS